MANSVIQTSFSSGEWTPSLNARVDMQKYHSGAALLKNFFVDYRGGATARAGTKYVIQGYISAKAIRLIPFQASFTVSYMLELGDNYIRPLNNGAPVLETPIAITGATQANPCVLSVANTYAVGDWIYVSGVGGMTQLNNNYYNIGARTAGTIILTDLNGLAINSTAFTAYTAGGTVQRVYKISSPFVASELAQIKYAQNVNILVLCHPNHPPQQLTLISATNWTIGTIAFGSTVSAPVGQAVASTLGAGVFNYAYVITAVDENGQESPPSAYAILPNTLDLRTVAGTNTVTWTAVTGAVSYNVYKAELRSGAPVPVGASFGFAGNCTGITFIDSNIAPDFSSGPPVALNPFQGSGVATILLSNRGSGYTIVPTVTIGAAPPGGVTATAYAYLRVASATINNGGAGYANGQSVTLPNGVVLNVNTTLGSVINTISIINVGLVTSGPVSPNPVGQIATSGTGAGSSFNLTWEIEGIYLSSPGTGYAGAPAVVISGGGGAAATTILGAPASGNPTVPSFFQQRLVLAGPVYNPQQFNMSQPGTPYNFNINNPLEPDDAIQGTLVSGQLNTIQSATSQPQGLIVLSDKQAWLINGGSPGSAVTTDSIVASSQAYNGSSYPPPIVANDHILYVQSKTSIVRDLVFNFYTQVYTGADVSILSSHLFYGFQILEWAWAEEPFKIVWAVRNDGTLLSLTFLKEQELVAWAHSDTQGYFKSVASITEAVTLGSVDALYTVVQRNINGNSIQYIERMAELYYPNGVVDAWCVDSGISYSGSPATTFSGAQHLAGAVVTGLADGIVIPPFTMPVNGTFTLPSASKVVVGLAYTPAIQTLELDLGEPTVQGKRKKIAAVTLKVNQTLGLRIGCDPSTTVPMKDLVRGNVGSATNTVTSGLVTGEVRTIIDTRWTVQGQYYIIQTEPLPASILGVIPEIVIGDTVK